MVGGGVGYYPPSPNPLSFPPLFHARIPLKTLSFPLFFTVQIWTAMKGHGVGAQVGYPTPRGWFRVEAHRRMFSRSFRVVSTSFRPSDRRFPPNLIVCREL